MWSGIKGLAAALLCAALFSAPAAAEAAGQALGSDIAAYINNNPIPSFSINGQTAVRATDLEGYGFTCTYNDYLRRVDLSYTGGKIAPLRVWRDRRTYGQPIANLLETDIETRLDGEVIQSFNADNMTAIYFSDLARCGELRRDEARRAVFLTLPDMPMAEYRPVEDRATAMAPLHFRFSPPEGRYVWDFTLTLPVALYDACRAVSREENGVFDYAAYASDAGDDLYIASLAACFEDAAGRLGLGPHERTELALGFVQSLPYADDLLSKGTEEYPNFPAETLFEQKGDCEDKSILLACLLKEMGVDAALLAFEGPSGGHMAVGIADDGLMKGEYYPFGGVNYFYAETTGPGWEIGSAPLEQSGRPARIIKF